MGRMYKMFLSSASLDSVKCTIDNLPYTEGGGDIFMRSQIICSTKLSCILAKRVATWINSL